MNIVILGAGEIGSFIANELSKEEHNVILIDKDIKQLEKVAQTSDVATLYGYGSRWKLLDQLIENEPDLFIAMTGNDETNLVSCAIAKNLGYPKTVARVKEIGFLARSRLDFSRLFYVDHFIGAEVLAANDILKSIINSQDLAIENFAHGAIQMRTLIVPETWKKSDIPLKDLKTPEEMIIALIKRKEKDNEVIIFPHGNDRIQANDEVTIIGEAKFMQDIYSFFKLSKKSIKSAVIVGGTGVALRLAHVLELRNISVKLIEQSKKRCQELAELLTKSTIINADGSNIKFLESENIKDASVFVACTNEDESNFLLASIAQHMGCKKVISLISNTTYAPMLKYNNIRFSISERVNILNRITAILYEEKIIYRASLYEGQAKILEIKVSEDSELIGIPLIDLANKLPKNMLITELTNKR
ncbi:MAG: Trk system potassium uptake protein TrkA, partial [Candidatus Anoxychlamydiales bacterium]|nr:Trk system potassium uptake protein TrkA [Candidatus Anoxychlamydiales bacterium]